MDRADCASPRPLSQAGGEIYNLVGAEILPEQDDFELIEGEIVPMAAAKADGHEIMKSR